MQEEINELPEDILDLEVDYLGAIADMVNQFGFPIIIALAMGYFIYFVWKFVTEELEPMIDKQKDNSSKTYRPNENVGPRPDKITREVEYCFRISRGTSFKGEEK